MVVDDLRLAWQTPAVRDRIRRVLTGGMLRRTPALAEAFLHHLQSLADGGLPSEQLYAGLREFLQRPQNQAEFARTYAHDEDARVARRVAQLAALVPDADRPARYADVGCGTGEVTAGLAKVWGLPPEHVLGVEVHERSRVTGAYTPVAFDGGTIPAADASQDVATLVMVLHHEQHPAPLVREVYRLLRDGGLLVARESDVGTPELRLFNQVFDRLYFSVFNHLPGVPTPANHRGVRDWSRLFLDAGFVIERTLFPEPDNPFTPVHFVLRKRPP